MPELRAGTKQPDTIQNTRNPGEIRNKVPGKEGQGLARLAQQGT
jgi:hypothetical protein